MTFQPPPPPPADNPPPPPPGGGYPGPQHGGYPPANRFDPKTVNPLDWGILGAGVLAFIFSFTTYYTYSVKGAEQFGTGHWNAWHGFFGWFAMLLALAGSALVALELFAPHVRLPWPNRLISVFAYALATLCVLLALFVVPDPYGIGGLNKGHGFGYWISFIVIIAGLVLSVMRLQQTGGRLPGALGNLPNIGNRSGIPGAAPAADAGPAPQAGYGTPPPPPGAPAPPQPGFQPPQQEYGPPANQ